MRVPRSFHLRGARPPPANPGAQAKHESQDFPRLV